MLTHLRPFSSHTAALALSVCLLAIAMSANAAEHDLVLDPASTELTFFLAATGHDVEGHLYLEEGSLHYDTDTGAASGRIVLSALRTETDNTKRDKTMHKKVLESTLFPDIVFVPSHIEGPVDASGAGTFDLVGTITLHGDEHEVAMPTDVEIDDDGRVTAHATLDVPFVDWGLKDPSLLILRVAKVVNVDIRFSAALDGGVAAGDQQAGSP